MADAWPCKKNLNNRKSDKKGKTKPPRRHTTTCVINIPKVTHEAVVESTNKRKRIVVSFLTTALHSASTMAATETDAHTADDIDVKRHKHCF